MLNFCLTRFCRDPELSTFFNSPWISSDKKDSASDDCLFQYSPFLTFVRFLLVSYSDDPVSYSEFAPWCRAVNAMERFWEGRSAHRWMSHVSRETYGRDWNTFNTQSFCARLGALSKIKSCDGTAWNDGLGWDSKLRAIHHAKLASNCYEKGKWIVATWSVVSFD